MLRFFFITVDYIFQQDKIRWGFRFVYPKDIFIKNTNKNKIQINNFHK